MRLAGIPQLDDFKRRHSDAASHVDSWVAEAKEGQWKTPHELKGQYPKASIIGDNQVVFNIRGNKYRLKVLVNYKNQIILVKNIGTHDEYMTWKQE